MTLRTRHTVLKAITIVISALTIRWNIFTGLVAMCLQTVVALADGNIWFRVFENMRGKIKEEREKPG